MAECTPIEWVEGPWGEGSWGGALPPPGGAIPSDATFDVYCVGPCGEMSVFTTYNEVEEYTGPNQISFFVDAPFDLYVKSGGDISDATARIFIDKAVPTRWTLDTTFCILDMPSDFADLAKRHFYIGVVDQQGGCAGLFFSLLGITYTGSVVHNGLNELVVNSSTQLLPGSVGLVQPDKYYTLRLVVDYDTQTTFIYITETSQLPIVGHQLKFILPTIPTASCVVLPDEGTTLSLRGTASEPVSALFDSLCLGAGLLIPNLPPVADAGPDQAARSCSIVQLDGSASFDPEGANLIYRWRLIDGPSVSQFVLIGDDGFTVGGAGVLTNKFFTTDAQQFDVDPGIVAGDVLLLDGTPYDIVATGIDGLNGYFIQIDGHLLDGALSGKSFRILKQNAISGKTTAKPTFYPDVPGLFKFDLTVFDGGLFSTSSGTIINVTESPVPRGCIPDLSFIWNYISDFWRLVDNTEIIETFWGALAQLAASELLTVWQHEYSKSLRDVQRTFQRRWLHYDLFIQEPLIEETTIRTIRSGVQSNDIVIAGGVSFAGQKIIVQLGDGSEFEIYLTQPTASPATVSETQNILARALYNIDNRFTVSVLTSTDTLTARLNVQAPFPFTFTSESTAASLFTYPTSNDLPRGTNGAPIGVNGYRVDHSLAGMDVQTGDFLVVDGVSYRIVRVVTDPTDTWASQRLVLEVPLPVSAGKDWVICGPTRSEFLDFYNSLCGPGDVAIYEVIQKADGVLAYVAVDVLSAALDNKTALLTEHGPIAPYLADPENYDVFFHSVYRRTYMPVDELVVEVPVLQEKIKNTDDTAVLRQNIDFFRTTFRGQPCIKFTTGTSPDPDVWEYNLPPKRLWAETTYLDNRPAIEQNFGFPAEFTLDNLADLEGNVDYLSVVRGLWYAYFTGPTLRNLRVGTQILLGLPFAEEAGSIAAIEPDFSPTQGRILVQDTNEQAIVRSYTYPRVLSLEVNKETGEQYKVGDTVAQFAPLVEGVEVVDYVKNPKWFEGHLNQNSFYEIEKFFRFLVRIDSAAFNLPALLFAASFIKRIKPTYTFPVLVVRARVAETTVDVTDIVAYKGRLTIFDGPWFQSTSQAQMFDQTSPSRGGYANQFDQADPLVPPTPFTPTQPTNWGFSQYDISPSETLLATLTTTFGAPTIPPADSIFYAGMPVFTNVVASFIDGGRFWFPVAGFAIGLPKTATSSVTLNKLTFFLRMASNATPCTLTVKKNNIVVLTHNFSASLLESHDPNSMKFQLTINIPVVNGDVLIAELAHNDVSDLNTFIESVGVVLGEGTDWAAGVPLPAGTYKTVMPL